MNSIDSSIIESLIAPVVMISANGLLYMGLNARLGRILARIRSFHLERLKMCTQIKNGQESLCPEIILRFEGIFIQGDQLLKQAHLIKSSITYILISATLMLLTSLSIGLTFFFENLGAIPGVLFVIGTLIMLVAIFYALIEIKNSLVEVEYEHKRMATLNLEKPA